MRNGHYIPSLSVQTQTTGLFKQAVIRLTTPLLTSDANWVTHINNRDLKMPKS